ncbi:hypothetical protein N7510_006404 [Penicillium lagena]|uniref:uncharacterized protein n=1 Tax=Penicillium lagena TaxID=94218 RepID=UPI00254216DA|nr:uncharacterized protein N7510_006404 [Penicillium lagena]KAJ5613210.1 hypothetical protein N7510_006404 [Penicillium lagena]
MEKQFEIAEVSSHGMIGSTDQEMTNEMERRVLRKIDMVVLPLMCLVFFSQYLDKQSLSYASVFGLIEDLRLDSFQFSWLGSMFYIGQFVSEFPFIYLMSRLPLVRFVGATIIIWGGICMCLAASTTFSSFVGVRFALGFAEGAVSPAFVTITSIWYKKEEHPFRIGLWISCNGLAQVLGALFMYGIGKMDVSMEAWKIMFLVCGALTSVLGIIFLVLMPTGPETAWFLTPDERRCARERLQTEADGGDQTEFSIYQLREAAADIRSYLNLFFGILITLPAPVIAFASLLIENLGYGKFDTMLYTCPSGAVQIFFIWVGLFFCHLWPHRRCAITIGLTIVPLTGTILLFSLPLTAGWGMIIASWLASVISNIFTILLSLSASNVRGNTKKAIVNALFFVGYSAGAVVGPLLWKNENAPRYYDGLVLALVSWVVLIAAVTFYWYTCYSENKKRVTSDAGDSSDQLGRDPTDKQNKAFRYST